MTEIRVLATSLILNIRTPEQSVGRVFPNLGLRPTGLALTRGAHEDGAVGSGARLVLGRSASESACVHSRS